MRFFNIFSRFIVSIVLMIGMFITYDIYIISQWANTRLLDKFVINVILKENANIEDLTNGIGFYAKLLKFKSIEYINKQQLFDEIRQKEEFNIILSILKENPFYDIIRIKFENFSATEFSYLLHNLKNSTDVKQVIYDYNLSTYLKRLEKFIKFYEILCIILISFASLILIFSLFNLDEKSSLLNIPNIVFIILFSIIATFNKEVINKLTSSIIIGDNILNYIIYGLIYLVGLFQNVITVEEGKDIRDE